MDPWRTRRTNQVRGDEAECGYWQGTVPFASSLFQLLGLNECSSLKE